MSNESNYEAMCERIRELNIVGDEPVYDEYDSLEGCTFNTDYIRCYEPKYYGVRNDLRFIENVKKTEPEFDMKGYSEDDSPLVYRCFRKSNGGERKELCFDLKKQAHRNYKNNRERQWHEERAARVHFWMKGLSDEERGWVERYAQRCSKVTITVTPAYFYFGPVAYC